ncbi:MAG TPA: hypothetical protein VG755_13470 [Nannocystaceae bacterium]|nr:hypothetical protein [Nannocystaceae bacterium]
MSMRFAALLLGGFLHAPASAPPSEPAAPTEPAATAEATTTDAPKGAVAVDVILPCGARAIVAQDLSLPVAAVVLAIETGTEDDPPDQPGLVHALAYHLLQGNREFAPGGITRVVNDGGGVTSLAIGPAQVRFESLVPASLTDDIIAAEASRLRAPSVSEALWKDTLRWARRDRGRTWALAANARAAVHQAEGLGHDGARHADTIATMSERAIGSQLADRFSYDRATIVVVSPEPPDLVIGRVLARFADLPEAPRRARDRSAAPRTGSSPRAFEIRGGHGQLVWPIAADPAAQAWARALCSALNHQKRDVGESNRARLRCAIEDDPRRGLMIMRPSGVDDPVALVRARLARLRESDAALLSTWRENVAEQLAFELRTPLALARHLARTRVDLPVGAHNARALAELLGATALAEPVPAELPAALAPLFDVAAATWLVEPGHGAGSEPAK